jgi:hypothetical protein
MNPSAQFLKLLDELEEQLDRGFFLSFIGKIVVEEKRLFSIIHELRTLAHEVLNRPEPPPAPPQPKGAPDPAQNIRETEAAARALAEKLPESDAPILEQALNEARKIRTGAKTYADEVLDNLAKTLDELIDQTQKQLVQIEKGRTVLKQELEKEEEVNSHGAT